MASRSHSRSTSIVGRSISVTGGREKTPFEQQREALIGEIAMVRIFLYI